VLKQRRPRIVHPQIETQHVGHHYVLPAPRAR
jgi:hypothetical protein